MNPWIARLSCILAFGAAACGSSDEKVNLGNDQPIAVSGAKLSDYAGTWVGYAEAYTFADGTDRVQLVLDASGSGSIKVGNYELPAVDITRGPPGSELPGPDGGLAYTDLSRDVLVGFPFSVQAADVSDSRIKFSFRREDAYTQYCAAFAPTIWPTELLSDTQYSCVPLSAQLAAPPSPSEPNCSIGTNLNDAGAGPLRVDCMVARCLFYCTCDASGCRTFDQSDLVAVDGTLENNGHDFVGTLVLGSPRVTIRLKRQ